MFKFKKYLSILLVVALMAGIAPAFAQSRYGLTQSDAIETTTALALPAGTWVYSLKLYADAGNSFAGVYDAATVGTCTAATIVDELGEATQYDSVEIKYEKPKYFATGVSVVMSTGVLIIDYGPEPTN
jgi:hypothetical protein